MSHKITNDKTRIPEVKSRRQTGKHFKVHQRMVWSSYKEPYVFAIHGELK